MIKMLTPSEVAIRLSITTRTAQRRMAAGDLPAIILPSGDYRITPEAMAAWELERMEVVRICRQTTPKRARRH